MLKSLLTEDNTLTLRETDLMLQGPPIDRTTLKGTNRIKYYDAFDEYHVKHNLSAMENLFAGYINARLDKYLKILQE